MPLRGSKIGLLYGLVGTVRKGTPRMQLSHAVPVRSAVFGEPDLVSHAGLVPTVRSTYGYAKQGAGYGYSGVKGLNAFPRAVWMASSAPVIVATRLREGSASSARGAARLLADVLATTRSCGAAGTVMLRADSAFQAEINASGREDHAAELLEQLAKARILGTQESAS